MSLLERTWLVDTITSQALEAAIGAAARGRLLDIGCGGKPYRQLALEYVSEYVGLDQPGSSRDGVKPDLESTAYDIPAPDGSFDTVLCTAVLEHLEEPQAALEEALRVLAPGGSAIYTAPLYWQLHEMPRDFYRFTEFGLRHLFTRAGFEEVLIEPLSGFLVTFGQEVVCYLWGLRKGGVINPLWWLIPPAGWLIQRGCYALRNLDRSPGYTFMYLVTARKPGAESEAAIGEANLHSEQDFARDYGARQPEFYDAFVERCKYHGREGKWLDLGAGMGLFTECARRHGIDITGLEGSAYGVQTARERYPLSDVRPQLLDEPLPFADGSISTIVCNQVIEYLPPQVARAMFTECKRVLEPRGVLIIYSPSVYNAEQRAKPTHIDMYPNMYSPSSLRRELRAAGFEIRRSPNAPLPFLGRSRAANYVETTILKLTRLDRLSATANCIAVKPSGVPEKETTP